MHGYFKISTQVRQDRQQHYPCARNPARSRSFIDFCTTCAGTRFGRKLTKEKQGMPGVDLHPAVGGAVSPGGPEYAQHRACGKVLSGVFTAVCNRGQLQVSKWPEEQEHREKVWARAAELVGLQTSSPLTASWTLRRRWCSGHLAPSPVKEARARRILAEMRKCGDPLVIIKDRGDRTVRGVSIAISEKPNELFGDHLYGIAAILAEVARPEGQQASRPVGVWAAQVKCK